MPVKPKKAKPPEPNSARAPHQAHAVAAASRNLRIAAILTVLSSLTVVAVWADWYYGLPDDAQATYVGRQACIECHQSQHEAVDRLAPRPGDGRGHRDVRAGRFQRRELEHYGVTSRMFRRDGKFFINTEGPDGKLADFEIKYVFGVDPLQQYMVEFDRPADMPASEVARVQVLRVSWDTQGQAVVPSRSARRDARSSTRPTTCTGPASPSGGTTCAPTATRRTCRRTSTWPR